MNRQALADRIINYSDALVAFSLVNALAFLIALADPETRCSIAQIAFTTTIVNLMFPITVTTVLIALRRFEKKLRGSESRDELVEIFWKNAQRLRFALVWVFSIMVVLGLWGSVYDTSCAVIRP